MLTALEDLAFTAQRAPANMLGNFNISEPVEIVRAMSAEDAQVAAQELRERNWAKKELRRPVTNNLRVAHHQLARLLASGVGVVEASYVTGKSVGVIYALRADPAFQELLEHYEKNDSPLKAELGERIATIGLLASEVLQERLEERPDSFHNKELQGLLEVAGKVLGDGRAAGAQVSGGLNIAISFVKNGEASESGKVIDAVKGGGSADVLVE